MTELRGPIFAKSDYAGFFRRMSALLIDAIIVVAKAEQTLLDFLRNMSAIFIR